MRRPKIGAGIIVTRNKKVLLGKRKNVRGAGSWCFPGGHLEFNEKLNDCARREVFEETGIKIKNLKLGPFTNDISKEDSTHYVTLFIIAKYKSGKVKVMEPEKCEKWQWFDWNKLPKPLFRPINSFVKLNYNLFKK